MDSSQTRLVLYAEAMTDAHVAMCMNSLPAVFVCSAGSLKLSGGVGICTQEYIRTLNAAGFRLEQVTYETDSRLAVRLLRKICPRPYAHRVPPAVAGNVLSVAKRIGAKFIFLNLGDLAPIARPLREGLSKGARIVLLSHGLESVDYLHAIRARSGHTAFDDITKSNRATLARQLILECTQRQFIDQVFCLAPFEVEIERWLGAKQVTWLPRTIPTKTLTWAPRPGRLGFVGSLDHPPNREGLELFASALSNLAGGRAILRVVGGPPESASEIIRRFPFIEYLGPLSNVELEEEAGTWNCFVNPIFCYARGCSTKLAVGLGWRIPVITTPAGCRGYSWQEGVLPTAETPEGLAKLAIQMFDGEFRSQAQREVLRIVNSAPSLMEVAAKAYAELMPAKTDSDEAPCLASKST